MSQILFFASLLTSSAFLSETPGTPVDAMDVFVTPRGIFYFDEEGEIKSADLLQMEDGGLKVFNIESAD